MYKRVVLVCSFFLFFCSVAFASMPPEEMFVGGVGVGCTMGYVEEIYGRPYGKQRYEGEGIRTVTYLYHGGFRVTGRTGIRDDRDDEDMIVVGFRLTGTDLKTPSGIGVGMSYWDDVVPLFGEGKRFVNYKGELSYIYQGSRMMEFSFKLDLGDEDTIIEIYQGTDW